MSWNGKYVRIEKLEAAENSLFPTPNAQDFKYGEENPGMSIPKGYWMTGTLVADIEVGKSLMALRDCRNGVSALGEFISSAIKSVENQNNGLVVRTCNSTYFVSETEDKRTTDQKLAEDILRGKAYSFIPN